MPTPVPRPVLEVLTAFFTEQGGIAALYPPSEAALQLRSHLRRDEPNRDHIRKVIAPVVKEVFEEIATEFELMTGEGRTVMFDVDRAAMEMTARVAVKVHGIYLTLVEEP